MLTTSNDEEDKIEAFNLNVAGYMLKSDVGNSFVKAVELVDNYWKVVEFPRTGDRKTGSTPEDRRQYVRHPDSRGLL